MKYLHIEYKNKDIAVFDFDGNYKPREAEAVATIAAALLEEKKAARYASTNTPAWTRFMR